MELEIKTLLLTGGLGIGLLFGALVQTSGFCFRSAVLEAYRRQAEKPQLWAWITAILVAIALTQLLVLNSGLSLSDTRYLGSTLSWAGLIVGGLVFGIGAILARGCGGRLTVLAATGNLRALMVLVVFAISAFATLRGILALPRIEITATTQIELSSGLGLVEQVSALLGATEQTIRSVVIALAALAAVAFAVIQFRRGARVSLFAGATLGLLIALSWWLTGVVAYDDFEPVPPEAVSFASTLADGLQFLIVYTGVEANFGVALIAGVLLGAVASAAIQGRLKLQSFSEPAQMVRYLTGGVLMGFGSVTALGCTFGQGLSGLSTLSIGSLIAVASIASGMVLTQKFLDRRRSVEVEPVLA